MRLSGCPPLTSPLGNCVTFTLPRSAFMAAHLLFNVEFCVLSLVTLFTLSLSLSLYMYSECSGGEGEIQVLHEKKEEKKNLIDRIIRL